MWKRANNWTSAIKEGKREGDLGGKAELPPFPSPQALLGQIRWPIFCAFHYIISDFSQQGARFQAACKERGVEQPGVHRFAIGPVNSALPFVEFKLQFRIVISIYQNFFWTSQSDFQASRCQLQLIRMASSEADFLYVCKCYSVYFTYKYKILPTVSL